MSVTCDYLVRGMKEFDFPHPCVEHHLGGENDPAAVRKVEGEYPAVERSSDGPRCSHRRHDDRFATCSRNSLRGASGGCPCGRNQQDAFILFHERLPFDLAARVMAGLGARAANTPPGRPLKRGRSLAENLGDLVFAATW